MKINFVVDYNVTLFYMLYITCSWDTSIVGSGYIFENCDLDEQEKKILEDARKYFSQDDGWCDDGVKFLWAYNNFKPKGKFVEIEKAIEVIKRIRLKEGGLLKDLIREKVEKVQASRNKVEKYFEELDVENKLERILQLHKNQNLKDEFPFFLVPQFRNFISAGANKDCVYVELSNKFTDESLRMDTSVSFHEMLHVMLDIKNKQEIIEEFDNPFPNSDWQVNNVQFEELVVYSLCSIFDNVTKEKIQEELKNFVEQNNQELVFIYKLLPESMSILNRYLNKKIDADETLNLLLKLYRSGVESLNKGSLN